jgi:S-formylglutathione hydrolase FrmB
VILDGNCALGHSVYANSDNNGPWSDALITEFIPVLEKKFRANGARLLMGHSSGGWAALWLQTQYPKVFDGCWSSAPDFVDFRSFYKVNLYEAENLFYDKEGSPRLLATVGGFIPWATIKTSYQMENVVYRGEQMHSYDAVFSKKGSDGMPESICNSVTGLIDTSVSGHWKNYDIALNLRNNWESLKSELDHKVRISVGNQDNFFLNDPILVLEKQMKELKSNFQFAYYPGDHFTVYTPDYKKDGNQFLEQKYVEWLAKSNTEKK